MDTTTTTLPPRADGPEAAPHNGRRPFAGLFSDLWRETTTLVRDEAELAKADLSEKVSHVANAAGSLAVGGAIAFAGFLVLLWAAVIALAAVLPPDAGPWLAPLIVGALVLAIGLIALSSGRRRLRAYELAPRRSAESLRRDQRMVQEHLQ